jgi:NAD+ synthase (glutamine-hydrolysing)
MTKQLRIVMAQLNLTVGDIQGNLKKSIHAAIEARDTLKADIIVFPELCLTGYPPEDLLLRKSFLEDANNALHQFKTDVQNIYCVMSHPYSTAAGLLNSCSLIYNGAILGRYSKQHLPNYGVFDEARYFIPGNSPYVTSIQGIPVGIVICEDLWNVNPVQQAANQGARLILSPNASPFEVDKHEQRLLTLTKRAKASKIPIIYTNCVGGQDEIVFDGGSMAIDAEGNICKHAGFFNETLCPVDIEFNSVETKMISTPFILPSDEEKIYHALVLGLRDYIQKNTIPSVLLGVSGGIDSALVLAIAVDALGKEKVKAILLPSQYTSEMSMEDGLALVNNLQVAHEIISIEPSFNSFIETLAPSFSGKKPDITEENLQARCRGVIMMALSNKSGALVLTTGNRSEMAVGYATLYGDMAGGLDVLKDIPKLLVYRLAHYRNQLSNVIPERIFERPPTAELAPDQKDEDSLPPYAILDKILELYLNQEQSVEDIIAQGFDRETVTRIVKLIHHNEYKRRQAAIGIRIHHKAFGRDRRYPITSKYKF